MIIIVDTHNRVREHIALRSMFEARKRVFVDLLKWDIPVLADRFEVDQFDDGAATYVIVANDQRRHLASARLLDTTRPALLDTLFPKLCNGKPPHGPNVREITRFCLSPEIGARRRLEARNHLLVALVEYAQANGISIYSGVADHAWFQQVEHFGWDCKALGPPQRRDGKPLIALRINITAETGKLLARNGIIAAPRTAQAA